MRTIIVEAEHLTDVLEQRARSNGNRYDLCAEEIQALQKLLSKLYVGGVQQIGDFNISYNNRRLPR